MKTPPTSHRGQQADGQDHGYHLPVLADEVVRLLAPRPGGRYCDGTTGGGGHSSRLLEACAPDGIVLSLDRDPEALAHAGERLSGFGGRSRLHRANFARMAEVVGELDLAPLDGILLDLGVSSHQFDTATRGFSLSHNGPLDMRMDPDDSESAADLIQRLSESELADIIYKYGEERASRRVARAIKRALARGDLHDTATLANVVAGAVRSRGSRPSRIHPATRTFQALRMAVNDELGALDRFLSTVLPLLRPGGRLAIIAFHSLEDRMVKQSFARQADPCTCPPDLPLCVCGKKPTLRRITRKPAIPGPAEQAQNPRSRSARLRVAEKLEVDRDPQ